MLSSTLTARNFSACSETQVVYYFEKDKPNISAALFIKLRQTGEPDKNKVIAKKIGKHLRTAHLTASILGSA